MPSIQKIILETGGKALLSKNLQVTDLPSNTKDGQSLLHICDELLCAVEAIAVGPVYDAYAFMPKTNKARLSSSKDEGWGGRV